MRCSICGGYDHEATTVGCPRHMASSFDHTRTYTPIGYIAGRLAALREVRAFVKAVEDCPSCHYTLAKIDALIKREEEK